MSSPVSRVLPHIQVHSGYVPGEQPLGRQEVIKLNTNENPYPPSPYVVAAINDEISKLRLYPNPTSLPLREAIADLHDLEPNQVLVGNGSDDILNLCARCFADHDHPVGMTSPSYSLYSVLASLQHAPLVEVPFGDEFGLDLSDLLACEANLFFLTTPNAPSGTAFANDFLSAFHDGFPGILVADEAYADFAPHNAVGLLADCPRLIITRTLSKSYGLAGLRVGYALGDSGLIEVLNKAREVYNVDRLAQAAAIASIRDQSYFQDTTGKIKSTRKNTLDDFRSRNWKTYESAANFLFTEPRTMSGEVGLEVAENLFCHLKQNGILVRHFPNHSLTSSFLRISIGQEDEMIMLKETLRKWKTHE
ncbi:MAG: histidinol-phosphate transaminase [Opitutales bacterium]|nr:histidinol-phosphate transaminase [Opitutales bacterium]